MKKLSAVIEIIADKSISIVDRLRERVSKLVNDLDISGLSIDIDANKATKSVENLGRVTDRVLDGIKADSSTDVNVTTEKATTNVKRLRDEFKKFKTATKKTELTKKVNVSTAAATKEIQRLLDQVEKLKQRTKDGIVSPTATSGLIGFAKNLAGAVTAAFAVKKALDLTVVSTIKFGKSFSDVVKNVEATTAQLDKIRDGILDISSASGQSAESIAAIAGAVGRTGEAADQILPLTDAANKVAVAFEISSDRAVAFLSTAQKSFDLDTSGALELADSINELGKNFATTEEKIVNFTQRVAPSTAQLNISAQDTAAFGAALLDLQIPTEIAATAVRQIASRLGNIQQATPGAEAALKLIGTTGQELADSLDKDASGAIRNLLEQISELSRQDASTAIKDIFGEEASKGVLALVGNLGNLDKAFKLSNDSVGNAGGVVEEFNVKVNSTTGNLDKAIQSIRNFGIEFSKSLDEPIGKSSESVAGFFQFLTEESRRADVNGIILPFQVIRDSIDSLLGIYREINKTPVDLSQAREEVQKTSQTLAELPEFLDEFNQAVDQVNADIVKPEQIENVTKLTQAIVDSALAQSDAAQSVEQTQQVYDKYFKQQEDGLITIEQLDAVTTALTGRQEELSEKVTEAAEAVRASKESLDQGTGSAQQYAESLRQLNQAQGEVENGISFGNDDLAAQFDARIKAQEDFNRKTIEQNRAALTQRIADNKKTSEAEEKAFAQSVAARNKLTGDTAKSIGNLVTSIATSVASLSSKTRGRLSEIYGEFAIMSKVGGDAASSVELLRAETQRLTDNQRALVSSSGSLSSLLTNLAIAGNKVTIQFLNQKIRAEELEKQLNNNTDATDDYIGFIERARDNLDLLDESQLDSLNAEIDKARNKLEDMTNAATDANNALAGISEGLLDEVDRFSGNLEAIEARRLQQQLDNIQELKDIQGADQAAAEQAERLARQAHQNRLQEIREQAAARNDADSPIQNNTVIPTPGNKLTTNTSGFGGDITLSLNERTLIEEINQNRRLFG
jgi:TP901 family phage tail tape measure protein